MAIVVDKLLGGTAASPGSGSTTISFTTSQAVASNGFIVVTAAMFAFGSPTIASVSGGGLTWTVDKTAGGETGSYPGSTTLGIASAQAPSGLASGTTITATLSASADPSYVMGGVSFTGVKATSPKDGTPPLVNGTDGSGAAWATGSQTLTAGSVLVGVALASLATPTNTPTSPAVEIFDVGATDLCGGCAEYRIESSGGSYNLAGTWSGSVGTLCGAVAYLAAAGGGTNATVSAAVAAGTAAAVAPPKPRPANPFLEINLRM